ncbi:aminotransferase class V-fold PLP-dependent enzyme [Nonomuraea glycinis]|uniref:Pyoverdine biosynthesis protein PvdN n=1 Tax=Nonomuraea glycinis TaxID=2047744 RepID=A0A918A909_9ACTN|nr:aminotransferase class V-fold PLP-dependent enzyme [Nonomuraea glycinis]MCA2177239.1 aminotransferase class V-fold PLP-dependent enzyme [Nonomuraea glycinis]GGP08933.1 pyoverdine biosynthesis protein PvdN [Nonomuraea glycinis]
MTRQLNRRALLGAGMLAGVAACTATPTPLPDGSPSFDPDDWESVRAQFALDPAYGQFAAFVLAPAPATVREAIRRHRDGLDADPHYLPGGNADPDGSVLGTAARFIGADSRDIALTDSTTMGLGLLYSGLKLRPGQDVLTTEHDFLATHEGVRLLADRTGAKVRRIRLYDDPAGASADRIVSAIKEGLRPRTRVVALTWVHSSTGVRLPIRAIADMLAEANQGRDEQDRALLCVDGVHGFGAIADGVDDLGCDFLATGTHKWLFGPRGTGFLWGRAWDAVAPVIPGFGRASFVAWQRREGPLDTTAQLATPGGYKAFEHRWAMTQAFNFQQAIGKDRIQRRTQELATRLKAGLRDIPHVRLTTPDSPDLSAGLVCCTIDGLQPEEAVSRLHDQKVVTSTTPYFPPLLRFGTSIVTDPGKVDLAIAAVRELR